MDGRERNGEGARRRRPRDGQMPFRELYPALPGIRIRSLLPVTPGPARATAGDAVLALAPSRPGESGLLAPHDHGPVLDVRAEHIGDRAAGGRVAAVFGHDVVSGRAACVSGALVALRPACTSVAAAAIDGESRLAVRQIDESRGSGAATERGKRRAGYRSKDDNARAWSGSGRKSTPQGGRWDHAILPAGAAWPACRCMWAHPRERGCARTRCAFVFGRGRRHPCGCCVRAGFGPMQRFLHRIPCFWAHVVLFAFLLCHVLVAEHCLALPSVIDYP
jgi:hypothetical protein